MNDCRPTPEWTFEKFFIHRIGSTDVRPAEAVAAIEPQPTLDLPAMTLSLLVSCLPSLVHVLEVAAAPAHEILHRVLEHGDHLVDLFIVHATFEALRSLFRRFRP